MPMRLFYSYSSRDERSRIQLQNHLSGLTRDGVIEPWGFRKLLPGFDWNQEIINNLDSAQIVLLLVSADFLASDYSWSVEVARALERHERGEAVVIPVILRECDWHSAPFAKLQALPDGGKPVGNFRSRDAAWTSIAKSIRRLSEQLGSALAPSEILPRARSSGAPSATDEGPNPVIRATKRIIDIAPIFISEGFTKRQAAASEVHALARDVSTNVALQFAASHQIGERVAAGIILREHVERDPNLAASREIVRTILAGIKDDHPRVRYRYVRAAAADPRLLAACRTVLKAVASADPDTNVKKEAVRVLSFYSGAG